LKRTKKHWYKSEIGIFDEMKAKCEKDEILKTSFIF